MREINGQKDINLNLYKESVKSEVENSFLQSFNSFSKCPYFFNFDQNKIFIIAKNKLSDYFQEIELINLYATIKNFSYEELLSFFNLNYQIYYFPTVENIKRSLFRYNNSKYVEITTLETQDKLLIDPNYSQQFLDIINKERNEIITSYILNYFEKSKNKSLIFTNVLNDFNLLFEHKIGDITSGDFSIFKEQLNMLNLNVNIKYNSISEKTVLEISKNVKKITLKEKIKKIVNIWF